MSFNNSSFNFFTDSGLTSPFGGVLSFVHKTDLSDNPQDTVLYLGSSLIDRQLQASSSPGVDNIVLTPTDTLASWVSLTGYNLGKKIQPTVGNGFVYQCTSAGTSGVSEPTWPTSPLGTTVSDGTCVWTLIATHHPNTEIKLALSSGGLSTATAGAALDVAATVLGGSSNAVAVYIRITNTVTDVSNDTGNEEIGIFINSCIETEIP